MSPTQSSPAGCVVGVLAIVPGSVAALGWFGRVRWFLFPVVRRHFDAGFWLLLQTALIGSLVAIGLVWLAIRILRSTDFRGYDSRDPDEQDLKW